MNVRSEILQFLRVPQAFAPPAPAGSRPTVRGVTA